MADSPKKTALIGYTGFVGSNILDSKPFDDLYNSSNIHEIEGREYDLVVTAGNRADSFRINNHGDEDRAEVDSLVDRILSARIRRLVLISTVCVYPGDTTPSESTPLSEDGLTPYGANRLHQERRLAEAVDTTIIRLPQLYGARLKKGVVYDLANDYRVEHIRPETRFQHYDVRRLWDDIAAAMDNGLPALNVATPPIVNAELAAEVFGRDISSQIPAEPESPFARMYTRDMRTEHAGLYGGDGQYLLTREQEIAGLRAFAAQLRGEGNADA
ncbi:NAD-dependent epimerase/dehydratase family protein [Microbacterium paludicola]|uniref:NAD-dependent epimerase/dehydratase family protein n=1 Tax=Microbacterium paludicola TaxID=300019 RepID=UPI00387954EC